MNFISRLIVLLVMSISLTTPAAAAVAVAVDVDGYCGAISADDVKKPDDKKTGGDKQPKEGDEEPECE